MKYFEKATLFTMASLVVAVTPAMAQPAGVPLPLAGAGLLGFGVLAYVGRKLRRTR